LRSSLSSARGFKGLKINAEFCSKFCSQFWVYFCRFLCSALLDSCFLNGLLFLNWLGIWIQIQKLAHNGRFYS
jgi:hypothetical protein